MERLSDQKKSQLQGNYSGSLWYITKQNCCFRDLMMMASILELWDDDPNESFESFFDRKKILPPYSKYIGKSPHRALKNCEFYGIMDSSDSKAKAAYSSKNLTDVYYTIKSICGGDYANTIKYQNIINKQLEIMEITVNGNVLNPILYTLKVLLVIGDTTGEYRISTQEFKLFVCTSEKWNQYYQTVESIFRFRVDTKFQAAVLEKYDIANDTRFNMVLKNLPYIESDAKNISILKEDIASIRKKVAEFEIGSEIITTAGKQWFSIANQNAKPIEGEYYTALRTKPFLLLAGISGTGKSRIVREFAFKSCPKKLQDKDGTTPGNYCMIEVKPNWHDSTELLGYYSNLNQKYQFTKFVKFLVKAKMFHDVPFFVCLDEMNLAPVEQYFAEILSILETRKHPKGDPNTIKTEAIVEARYFKELEEVKLNYSKGSDKLNKPMTDRQIYMELFGIRAGEEDDIVEETNKYDLTTEGLTLPDNVLIIGTVNMDDTTHQFSRKVIDRAMTIEMNGGKLADMYGGSKDLEYLEGEDQQRWQMAFKQHYVSADEVLENYPELAEDIKRELPKRLEEINQALKGTPFEVSYRVLNELTIMVGVMLDEKGEETNIDDVINQAVDYILLMKILPRIEGDREMFAIKESKETRLGRLKDIAPNIEPEKKGEHRQAAKDKIQEMIDRLDNQEFTRFWP